MTAPAEYLIVFDRISRNHDVPPLTITATNPDDIAEEIYQYARPHLRSHDIEVIVDLGQGDGFITAGLIHTAGRFTIRRDATR